MPTPHESFRQARSRSKVNVPTFRSAETELGPTTPGGQPDKEQVNAMIY